LELFLKDPESGLIGRVFNFFIFDKISQEAVFFFSNRGFQRK
jgi:hypothetical protein